MAEPLYPITIIATRYGGIYEGGEWAAFPVRSDEVPAEAQGDDVACATWWDQFASAVGVGKTPGAALTDLEAKSLAGGRRIPYPHRRG